MKRFYTPILFILFIPVNINKQDGYSADQTGYKTYATKAEMAISSSPDSTPRIRVR
jgi:hypothetical protein